MSAGGGAGQDLARGSLASDMIFRKTPLREPMDDVERHPRRGSRPTPRAQWDEVHACWVEWDDEDGLWVHVDHPVAHPARPTPADDPGPVAGGGAAS